MIGLNWKKGVAMSDYTPEAQIDWSEVVVFGEDNEVIGYFTPEDADEFFSDASNESSL